MTLRRFPWKQPRSSDNSFKLFVSSPSPGTPATDIEIRDISRPRPRSAVDLLSMSQQQAQNGSDAAKNPHERASSQTRHHRRQGSSQSERRLYPPSAPVTKETKGDSPNDQPAPPPIEISGDGRQKERQPQSSAASTASGQSGQRQEPLKGPWRLVRLLPRESRYIVTRMLKLKPRERATLEEVLGDFWLRSTDVCRQTECGEVINSKSHSHVLEPPSSAPPAAPKRKV